MRQELNTGRLAALVVARRGTMNLRQLSQHIHDEGHGDVSPSTLSRIETEKMLPDLSTLFILCDWLSLPVSELIQDMDAGQASQPDNELATLAERVAALLYTCPGFDRESAVLVAGLLRKLIGGK